MPSKILVTGCNGFIGTNFVNLICATEPDVHIVNIDCLDFPITANNHIDKGNNYEFVHGSILDKELLDELFKKHRFNQVINFAANSHVDNSITNPEAFIENNIIGTQRLLDVALKNDLELFLHISTDEVYGSLAFDAPATTEDSQIQPNNPYSASKAGADCLVRSYHRTFKLPAIITRSSNNFGPYQYPEKLIPVVISNALNNQQIPVYGKGENVRDWIYVTENCRAIKTVIEKGRIGEVYNIPGYEEVNNLQLVTLILDILGKPRSLISFVEDRKGHDLRYCMDGSKLKSLGFSYDESFRQQLEHTIAWYQEHPEWLMVKAIV
jgi:dTDP-glucose 4,6-dehydratase